MFIVVLTGGIVFMATQDRAGKWESLRKSTWWEYIQVIAVAFILVFGFMRPFVVEAFKIPSASMEDTLKIGDRILVAKFIYGIRIPFTKIHILDFHKPAVGDIFVFKPPPAAGKTQNFIKRIVGVPGDVIQVKGGNLYRNGMAVVGENYVKRHPFSPNSPQNFGPFTVLPGYVFAMGDNRDRSSDSRVWGPVPMENIKGQAFLIYWSWDRDGSWLHKIRLSRIGRRVK
jgi:signal peptidase I